MFLFQSVIKTEVKGRKIKMKSVTVFLLNSLFLPRVVFVWEYSICEQ